MRVSGTVAKTADLIVMMLDATKSLDQRRLLETELEAVGIRINKKKPDGERNDVFSERTPLSLNFSVVFKKKTAGGVSFFPHIGYNTFT